MLNANYTENEFVIKFHLIKSIMALWGKIQSLNTDCQRDILSLYNEEHPEFKFPIEVRNLFADIIENACGVSVATVDGDLEPSNPQHRDSIINFFTSLSSALEERLKNDQAGDQFFTKVKLNETLAKITEKKQTDPLGLFEYMKNRIKAEQELVSKQEAATSGGMPFDRDGIMEKLYAVRTYTAQSAGILKDIRTNEEQFALQCNKKQEIEAILNDPELLYSYNQQKPGYEAGLRTNLTLLENHLPQNIRVLQSLMQNFERIVINNLNLLAILEEEIVNEKVAIWKHEQQKMANGIHRPHTVSLDKIQVWCEELADLIWKHFEQLKEAERILQNGIVQTGDASDLTFVQNNIEEVIRLLQDLLNHSLIVEEQPPQIIKMKMKFPKSVVVSLLIGKRLNIHMDRPTVSTCIISEEQAKSLPVADEVDKIGEITNGVNPMECKDESDRLSVSFRSMQLRSIKRTDRKGNVGTERVMEEKSCLYFVCWATVGPLKFKVSTISLPVVVISRGSQEALAVASISWDNAFGEIGRSAFKVPGIAPWSEIAQILNAKFYEVSGRGLTEDNLACLAQKAFRNRRPQPETITWLELCKENLPGRNFTFWAWFFGALKLIEKKETHLKDVWKEGLIEGFIDRDSAEQAISRCEPGTFLLRFAHSIVGAITIALFARPGAVVSLNPYQLLDLQTNKLTMQIKEISNIKYLYQKTRCLTKDEAFGQFYDKENAGAQGVPGSNGKPYVSILPTIPDGDNSNGSATPVPSYDGGQRWSLPELSPLPIEQFRNSPSPFFVQSPPSGLHEMQNLPRPIIMDPNAMIGSPEISHLYPDSVPTAPLSPYNSAGELETPLPLAAADGQAFNFTDTEMFDDFIRVIRNDTVDMEM